MLHLNCKAMQSIEYLYVTSELKISEADLSPWMMCMQNLKTIHSMDCSISVHMYTHKQIITDHPGYVVAPKI